jgi:hypothetical protein
LSSSGQQLVAGRVPGERIGTTTRTSDSSGFTTTETLIDTVTVSVVSGRTYRVTWHSSLSSTVAGDDVLARIREDSGTSGTQLSYVQVDSTSTSNRWPADVETEFTASSTGSKTFSGTMQRTAGSGTITVKSAATSPTYLYVDYIRG